MKRLLRKLKEVPRVQDALRIFGKGPASTFSGSRMPDGSPVPVETIMQAYGVDRARAAQIATRQTR